MVTNSIHSGSWGNDIPGVENSQIGSRPNTSGTYNDVDFESERNSWWSGETSKFNKAKDILIKGLDYILEIFATVLSVTEIVFFFIDLLQETYTQDFYEYVTSDGTSFYWNGGSTVTRFFGFDSHEVTNIDNMELINPIKITLPQIEEFYYYNGIKYYNPNELKRRILLDYLNGVNIPNKKFERYFAILKNDDSSSKTIDELIDKIITSLNITKKEDGSFNIDQLNKNSPYIQTLSASYDYGYIVSENDNNVTLIENIVNNIRPANFVILPTVEKDRIFLKNKLNNISDLPGKYWDNNKVVITDNSKNVLVDNSANDLKEEVKYQEIWKKENFVTLDYNEANKKSLDKLYEEFKSKFTIKNKDILNISNFTNKYSDLSDSVKIENIYEVKDPKTGKIYNFYNFNQASNYLYNLLNFKKETNYIGSKIYFDGKYFNNNNELMLWVKNNTITL